jgi:predicted glutamine amidotransferase
MENPIDKDKITENPHNLPYAHNIGSAVVKPLDKGKIKGKAMAAMYEQTQSQMDQLREQMQLIANQAKKLQNRIEISEKIYLSDMGFEPLTGHTYHLYERKNGQWVLSMVGPDDWGRSMPFEKFIATVKMLSDHTWEVVE